MYRHPSRRLSQRTTNQRRRDRLSRRPALYFESLEPRIVMDGQTEVIDVGFGFPIDSADQPPAIVDDHFDVFPNGERIVLDVLANDSLGYSWFDEPRISSVSDPTQGGRVEVIQDGHLLHYTPAADFVGEDTFTYSVGDKLQATVHVDVNAPSPTALPKFGSTDELKQFVIDEGLRQYKDLFGKPAWGGWWGGCWEVCPMLDATGMQRGDAVNGNADLAVMANAQTHSDTNVQVAGVDEGDIVETDGEFLYILHGRELVITTARPATEMAVVSRSPLKNPAVAEYLHGNRLTVITNSPTFNWGLGRPMGMGAMPWAGESSQFVVTVFDISDRTQPVIVQETKLDGALLQSRAIGSFVFLVVTQNFNLPDLEQHCATPAPINDVPPDAPPNAPSLDGLAQPIRREFPGLDCTYETRDEFVARMQDSGDSLIGELLPHYTTYAADGSVVGVGLLTEPADFYRPVTGDASTLLSLVTIDALSSTPAPIFSTGLLGGSQEQIYASAENLYVLGTRYNGHGGRFWNFDSMDESTSLLKFAMEAQTGRMQLVATGNVPGHILNQFSVDEYEGYLRIATTSGAWGGNQTNRVSVLGQDGQRLEVIGAVDDLAPGERIYSVRFVGDTGYVVTFVELDPLFVIDLADPAHPRVAGELHIPGFSDYLQPLDENHLLAIGRGAVNEEFSHSTRELQISLFDVSAADHPVLVDRYSFAGGTSTMFEGIDNLWRGGQSLDHHAFSYFPESGTLAIPIHSTPWIWNFDGTEVEAEFTGDSSALALFHVDPAAGFTELGRIEHDSRVRRSLTIGDDLYSIANHDIKVVSLADPITVIGQLEIGPPANELPPGFGDPGNGIVWPWVEIVADDNGDPAVPPNPDPNGDPDSTPGELGNAMQKMIELAIQDLAAGFAAEDGQVLFACAESVTWIDEGLGIPDDTEFHAPRPVPGFRIELEFDQRRFVYHSDANGEVAMASIDDEALTGQIVNHWFNIEEPADADNDDTVSPRDVVVRLNDLNANGPRPLPRYDGPGRTARASAVSSAKFFLDANNDFYISAIDALLGINFLNARLAASAHAEGEDELTARDRNVGLIAATNQPTFAESLRRDSEGALDKTASAHGDDWRAGDSADARRKLSSTALLITSESSADLLTGFRRASRTDTFEEVVDRLFAKWASSNQS